MPKMTMSTTRVHYREAGAGPPVVMLHATLHDHHDFDAIFDAVAREFHAIAVDWPFHGESTQDSGLTPTAMVLADVLEELVDALELGPAVFIGNSVGGYAAARLAIRRSGAVAALVLVNTGGFTPSTPATRAFCRVLGRSSVARRVMPTLVPRYMKPRTDNDRAVIAQARGRARTKAGAEVAAGLWRSFIAPEYDLRGEAAQITAPTLVMWGVKDVVLPLKAGVATHDALPNSEFVQFDTGHVPFSSDPDAVLARLLPFLHAHA
jgi:Predicted hydrolases or acyltransferases (alpha/beta hydrolase superfamily)